MAKSKDDDVINEVLKNSKPGFRRAKAKAVADAPRTRAKPEASTPDIAKTRGKKPSYGSRADFVGSEKRDASDVGDLVLQHFGSTSTNDDEESPGAADVRIVKVENTRGQKTRAVLDVAGKKKIGEAS